MYAGIIILFCMEKTWSERYSSSHNDLIWFECDTLLLSLLIIPYISFFLHFLYLVILICNFSSFSIFNAAKPLIRIIITKIGDLIVLMFSSIR